MLLIDTPGTIVKVTAGWSCFKNRVGSILHPLPTVPEHYMVQMPTCPLPFIFGNEELENVPGTDKPAITEV